MKTENTPFVNLDLLDDPSSSSITATNLTCSQKYEFRGRAINNICPGLYSDIIEVETGSCSLPAIVEEMMVPGKMPPPIVTADKCNINISLAASLSELYEVELLTSSNEYEQSAPTITMSTL
jgi:hypothetical protein